MKKFVFAIAAVAFSLSAVSAQANGWGKGTSNGSVSSGLINISPSIQTGNLKLLSGTSILNGVGILNGNNVSGILNGNKTGIVSGVLSGIGISGILGGNSYKVRK
jgi:hypothetical protein